ncbi:Aldehyde/histidinol dehydrogenase [Mycena alexandri]|uniref:Aldehyde/histidinol dehydrogenase n=1 Tax=Mycena alexandri TaxID=1745969 RepID=A0AAD6WX89_9AGAR|nr:Aldehyde/histidinol dehydrogenase [Mycena alexandri]
MLFTVPLLINGEEKNSSTTVPIISPCVAQASYSSASHADADAVVAAAFPAWSKTKSAVRRDILIKAADLLQARAEEFQTHMIEETGSGAPFAPFDVFTAADHIRDAAGRISPIAGSIPVCKDEGTTRWNADILGAPSVVFSIATGNTCPRCVHQIGRAFTDAGLPGRPPHHLHHPRRLPRHHRAAAVVLEDADLERAALQCVVGAFLHAGRLHGHRAHLVCASVVDATAGFAPAEGAAGWGRSCCTGTIRRSRRTTETGEASGTRMRPVVVEGATIKMALHREESFGLSVSLIAVTNASEYGLNRAVFTRDLARSIQMAKKLECGSVHINSMSVHDEAVLPYDGAGFVEFLRSKTITFQE